MARYRSIRLALGLAGTLTLVSTSLLASPAALAATSPTLWRTVSSANTSAAQPNQLVGVSCPSAGDCWAVGTYTNGSATQTLIEQDSGSGWSIVASPNEPGAPDSQLAAVTCVGTSDCWAVGSYTTSTGLDQVLVEQYTPSGWAIVPAPDQGANQDNALLGVACASATDCWAVGEWAQHPLIELDNGTGWALSSAPSGSASELLDAVTCLGSGDCWAAGFSYGGTADQTLIEQEVGGTWWVAASPDVPGGDDDLAGIACTGTSTCFAVGDTFNGTVDQTLVEQDSGSGWSIVSTPDQGRDDTLSGVACDGAGDCWAVGAYDEAAGGALSTLIEEGTGAGWAVVSSPNVATNDDLFAVNCLTECAAVGSYISLGTEQTLAEETYQPSGEAYTALTPFRLCDTRRGTGTECSGTSTDNLLGQGQTMTVQVTGVPGPAAQVVPASAAAVVLDLTAVSGTAATFLATFPAGTPLPVASNLNVQARTNQANLVVVPLGSGGKVSIYNSLGTINLLLDVQGYFAPPSGTSPSGLFHPIPPLRICDTRRGTGTECSGINADAPLGPGQWLKVILSGTPPGAPSGTPSVPSNGTAASVAFNLGAVSGTSDTFLAITPPNSSDACPSGTPSASNLNVNARTNLDNRVVSPIGPQQDVCIYNSLGSINLTIDVNGWFGNGSETTAGAQFYPIAPTRLCDTRSAATMGYATECSGSPLQPGTILPVQVSGVDGIPAASSTPPPVAVVANLTAVSGTSITYFTLDPSDGARPTASDLNTDAAQNTANLTIVQLSVGGTAPGNVDLYNNLGTINAILDVSGWFQ
jgi:hypothetical protein